MSFGQKLHDLEVICPKRTPNSQGTGLSRHNKCGGGGGGGGGGALGFRVLIKSFSFDRRNVTLPVYILRIYIISYLCILIYESYILSTAANPRGPS